MNIVVTGGAGFVGANLCRALSGAGHRVTAFDDLSSGASSNLDGIDAELVVGTILDPRAIRAVVSEADSIVHLAARPSVPRSIADPVQTHLVNVTGTVNVLEAVRADGPRQVITAGSSSVYGANPTLPKHVGLAPRPVSPYAASKLAAEAYTLAYGHSYDMPTLSFRFFNIFGPLQAANHAYAAVIPSFVNAALNGRSIPVHGDGRQTRDFTFVDTVTAVIVDAVQRQVTSPEPINLAYGSRIELLAVVDLMRSIMGEALDVEFQPSRVADVPHSQADDSQVRQLFPSVSPTPLDEGLAATIDWMRKSRN